MRVKELLTEAKLQYPSKGLILKVYNKYRKDYDYSNEVRELREKVLPLAQTIINNTKRFQKEYDDLHQQWDKGEMGSREYDSKVEKLLRPMGFLVSGQGFDWAAELQKEVRKLKRAKTDFAILAAIDRVFNFVHDQGPILIHMVKGRDKNDYDALEDFINTLNTLRDW